MDDQDPAASSAWEQAIEFGIDVTLLEANLARTPAERLRELVAMNHLHARIQARTLSEAERRRLDDEELLAKFGELLGDGL
jgi:hypothetical protein